MLGCRVRVRKASSVRKSPIPSASHAATSAAPAASPTLPRSSTGYPSAVRVPPTLRCAAGAAVLRAGDSVTSATRTRPVPPSTRTRMPVRRAVAPAATTAGMPRDRATIDVWLIGPPASVMSPATRSGSRPAASAAERSRAMSTVGSRSSGTPPAASDSPFSVSVCVRGGPSLGAMSCTTPTPVPGLTPSPVTTSALTGRDSRTWRAGWPSLTPQRSAASAGSAVRQRRTPPRT